MKRLSDKQIIDAYYQALQLKLDQDFIFLLKLEIERRCLPEKHNILISS